MQCFSRPLFQWSCFRWGDTIAELERWNEDHCPETVRPWDISVHPQNRLPVSSRQLGFVNDNNLTRSIISTVWPQLLIKNGQDKDQLLEKEITMINYKWHSLLNISTYVSVLKFLYVIMWPFCYIDLFYFSVHTYFYFFFTCICFLVLRK